MNKEKQEFQLGDTAYMIDSDYRCFESEIWQISLHSGEYCYQTHDCDFTYKDIDEWVFKSELSREIKLMPF